MEQPQEVEDEGYERVWERVAAVDVAKATGAVCTRVPGAGPAQHALASHRAAAGSRGTPGKRAIRGTLRRPRGRAG